VESNVKTLDVIRRRLAAPRRPLDPRARLLGNIDGPISPQLREVLERPGQPASVLLALLPRRGGPTVLFTERAAHLKDHGGQVSLPGGRLAAGETPVEAALREAHEEVGLAPAAVEVIGSLDQFVTGTGFMIEPVVGIVADPEFVATPDAREVAGVFEVPLTVVLDRTAMAVGYFERHGSRLLTYELNWAGRRIWGATAAVLRNFQDVILDE
jgi:8-oxo-dGTP pyrophosphatase MutT (NUDIX family)